MIAIKHIPTQYWVAYNVSDDAYYLKKSPYVFRNRIITKAMFKDIKKDFKPSGYEADLENFQIFDVTLTPRGETVPPVKPEDCQAIESFVSGLAQRVTALKGRVERFEQITDATIKSHISNSETNIGNSFDRVERRLFALENKEIKSPQEPYSLGHSVC